MRERVRVSGRGRGRGRQKGREEGGKRSGTKLARKHSLLAEIRPDRAESCRTRPNVDDSGQHLAQLEPSRVESKFDRRMRTKPST